MTSLALSVCILFMSSSFTTSTSTRDVVGYEAPAPFALLEEEARFVELANAERLKIGLDALELDPVLVQAARRHSREMSQMGYFSHQSPTSELKTPMRRYLAQLGYRPNFAMVGENLFYCSRVDVNRGQRAFMESKDHRENLLNGKFEYVGVGVYVDRGGGFWVTQMFLSTNPAADDRHLTASSKVSINR